MRGIKKILKLFGIISIQIIGSIFLTLGCDFQVAIVLAFLFGLPFGLWYALIWREENE